MYTPTTIKETFEQWIDLSNIMTIVEIGSWHGNDAKSMATTFPNAEVYYFEPNPDYYDDCLSKSKGMSNMYFINKAVINKNGYTDFYPTNSGNGGISSIYSLNDLGHKANWSQKDKVRVECVSINQWGKDNNISQIDLAEIDVQGAELLCLEGMTDYLNGVRGLMIEVCINSYYNGKQAYQNEVVDLLTPYGFELMKYIPDNDGFVKGFPFDGNCWFINERFKK